MAGAPKGNTNAEKYCENYILYDDGRLYSCLRNKFMMPNTNGSGYLKTDIRVDGLVKTVTIHRAVAEMFVENPSGKPCVNHIDGNKLNNSARNLEWVTYSENIKHSYSVGIHKNGQEHPNSRMSKNDVLNMRKDRANGVKYKDLSLKYGVSTATAHKIVSGKYYKQY